MNAENSSSSPLSAGWLCPLKARSSCASYPLPPCPSNPNCSRTPSCSSSSATSTTPTKCQSLLLLQRLQNIYLSELMSILKVRNPLAAELEAFQMRHHALCSSVKVEIRYRFALTRLSSSSSSPSSSRPTSDRSVQTDSVPPPLPPSPTPPGSVSDGASSPQQGGSDMDYTTEEDIVPSLPEGPSNNPCPNSTATTPTSRFLPVGPRLEPTEDDILQTFLAHCHILVRNRLERTRLDGELERLEKLTQSLCTVADSLAKVSRTALDRWQAQHGEIPVRARRHGRPCPGNPMVKDLIAKALITKILNSRAKKGEGDGLEEEEAGLPIPTKVWEQIRILQQTEAALCLQNRAGEGLRSLRDIHQKRSDLAEEGLQVAGCVKDGSGLDAMGNTRYRILDLAEAEEQIHQKWDEVKELEERLLDVIPQLVCFAKERRRIAGEGG